MLVLGIPRYFICKTYLSDILVSYSADLLDVGSGLGNVLEGVSEELELILLVIGGLDLDTWLHDDSADNLLTNEVSDLDLVKTGLVVLLDVDVDWEMGVDVSHLVLESLGNTDDQVVDEGTDSSEGGDVLAGTMVELDVNDILLWVGEVDCQMGKVLGELSCSFC